MQQRVSAIKNLTKKNLLESCLSPGVFIALSCGLLIGYLLIFGFVDSIGSSGFKPERNPLFQLLTKGMSGAFGETLVNKLFSEGPYVLSLFLSFLPMLVYLALSSVYKFGLEKNSGALELIVYGPVDGTDYFLGILLKNMLLTMFYLVVLMLFFMLSALLNNLVLGSTFFYALGLFGFVALAIFAYNIFISVLTDNAASGIALFLIVFLFFTLLQIASFAVISGYVKNLAGTFSWLLQWLSPVYYWSSGLAMVEYGQVVFYFVHIALLLVLAAGLLLLSHLILRARGVRG